MGQDVKDVDQMIDRLDQALKAFGQGRVYDVGTMVLLDGEPGTVVDLNKDSTDPTGSTVDIRMFDGKVIEGVSVSSKTLQRYRA